MREVFYTDHQLCLRCESLVLGRLDASVIKIRTHRFPLRLGSKGVGDTKNAFRERVAVRRRRMKGMGEGISLAAVPNTIRPDDDLRALR